MVQGEQDFSPSGTDSPLGRGALPISRKRQSTQTWNEGRQSPALLRSEAAALLVPQLCPCWGKRESQEETLAEPQESWQTRRSEAVSGFGRRKNGSWGPENASEVSRGCQGNACHHSVTRRCTGVKGAKHHWLVVPSWWPNGGCPREETLYLLIDLFIYLFIGRKLEHTGEAPKPLNYTRRVCIWCGTRADRFQCVCSHWLHVRLCHSKHAGLCQMLEHNAEIEHRTGCAGQDVMWQNKIKHLVSLLFQCYYAFFTRHSQKRSQATYKHAKFITI